MADSEGRYLINGLEQGKYQIRVSKEGYAPDQDFNNRWSGPLVSSPKPKVVEPAKEAPGEIEVFPNACQVRDLGMWAKGGFRGKVQRPDGSPIEGVAVQAFELDSHGMRESSPLRTGVSGRDGKYNVEPLPAGRCVIGINASKYEDVSSYHPTIYDGGMAMPVGESRSIEGVDFALPEPRVAAV